MHSSGVSTPGQFGPISRDFEPRQRALDPNHVEHRNALGDRDDQRHLGVDRLEDRVRGEWRRDVDHGRRRTGLRNRLVHGVEHRQADMLGPALPRSDAADHLGAVSERLLRVERAGLAGHPLGDDLGVAVDEDAHATASSARLLSICLQASSSSFTASTLTLKFSRASALSSISTIALDAAGTDHARDADVEVLDAILAGEMRGAGEDALLVLQKALGHRDRAGRGRVIGAAGLQERDDLAAAAAGTLDDRVDLVLRRPAHLDEVGDRDPGDGRIFDHRHHRVAVAAEHERRDVLDADVELLGEEGAKARTVEHAGHADDHLRREAGEFAQRPHHRVERVGDADDEGVGGVLANALADRLHDLEVDSEQVVPAHARLARHAGGDDAHVGAFDVGIVGRALGARHRNHRSARPG